MNPTKHPRFIKELPAANLLLSETCPLAEVIVETLVFAGIDPDQPVYTADGDRVRLLCVDHDHQFPIVGEVIDFGAETSWLARWSASGLYAGGSQQSIARHSLSQNAPLGGIVEPACGCVVSHEARGATDFKVPPLFIVVTRSAVAEFRPKCTHRPQVRLRQLGVPHGRQDPPGSGDLRYVHPTPEPTVAGRFPHLSLNHDVPTPPTFKGATVADAVLSDWPLPLGSAVQAESAEVIGRAKRAVAKWTRDHAEYPNLRAIVSPLIDLTKVEEATTDAHLTPAAHLWSLVAFYAMAGRLRLGGKGADTPAAAASMTPVDLQRIVDGCRRAGNDGTYGYWIAGARLAVRSVASAGPPRQSRLTVAPPRAGLP
jgi:hypothetical protein